MFKKIFTLITASLVTVITLQLFSCGTLMYPERRGQKQGEIDIKVAVFDGLGLLFGIIPGVIAYVVDFSTGAIYLPAGKRNMVMSPDSLKNSRVIFADKTKLNDKNYISALIQDECNLPSNTNWDTLRQYPIDLSSDNYAVVSAINTTTLNY